jgi:hypothetical protein
MKFKLIATPSYEIIRPLNINKQLPYFFIFDVHGTILQTNWQKEYRYIYNSITGNRPDSDWIANDVLGKTDEQIMHNLSGYVKSSREDIFSDFYCYRDMFRQHVMPPIMPEVKPMLNALTEQKYRIEILSGSEQTLISKQLRHHQLDKVINIDTITGYSGARHTFSRLNQINTFSDLLNGHNVILFDDWFLESHGITTDHFTYVALPQGEGDEYDNNRTVLIDSGAHIIANNWDNWSHLFETLGLALTESH